MRNNKIINSFSKTLVKLTIKIIDLYGVVFSRDRDSMLARILFTKKSICVFYPTCSEYMKEALAKYGFFKGFILGVKRILRCHPWQKEHIDLVP